MYKFVVGFAWMVITLWSCSDDPGKIGLGLLPTGDLIHIGKDTVITVKNIKAYTLTDEKQRTDEPANNLLGTFNDPIFGKTTTDFACQFRLSSFPKFKKNDFIDSLVYYVDYQEIYGDTVTPQKLKIYELASDLVFDDKYYQDVNLKGLAKSEVLADYNYIPKFKLDSLSNRYGSTKKVPKDTVQQEISFQLNHSLATKLMNTDSLTLSDNDLFIKHFKGLYIEAGDLSQGGTILKTTGSGLVLYYSKDKDTTKYSQTFYNTKLASRVSRFTHDYSTAVFSASLDKPESQDSLIYLQTTGGLRTKILIPNLGNWSDSTNFAINRAELIFQVDTTVSDVTKLLPPEQLVISAIGLDTLGKETEYFPSDLAFSQAYYGGIYNKKTHTYRFNIAKHMQEVIEKKQVNLGFYLSTAFRSEIFRRTVLKGAGSKTGIKLEITYSKIK